jgi:hypothetical protein
MGLARHAAQIGKSDRIALCCKKMPTQEHQGSVRSHRLLPATVGSQKMKKHKNMFPHFVMVTNQVLDSPAWRAMSHGARSLYIVLKRRYSPNGKNNGKIFLSEREAKKQLGSGFTEIVRWYRELQHYGFIEMMNAGCLGLDGKGKAPLWRLTEVGYMRGKSSPGMEDMPTMDFLKWNGVPFNNHHRGGDHLKPRKPKSGSKPWEAAGMSRSAWYRHGRSSAEMGRSRNLERPSKVRDRSRILERPAGTSGTESRSRIPERDAPEFRSGTVPENQSVPGNNRSRIPEHMSQWDAPEFRSISNKPSREGGRDSFREQPQTPVSEASPLRGNGHDATPAPEPVPVDDDMPASLRRCVRCNHSRDDDRGDVTAGRDGRWRHAVCHLLEGTTQATRGDR